MTDATGAVTGDIMNATPTNRSALTVLFDSWLVDSVLVACGGHGLLDAIKEPEKQITEARVPLKEGIVAILRNGPMKRIRQLFSWSILRVLQKRRLFLYLRNRRYTNYWSGLLFLFCRRPSRNTFLVGAWKTYWQT